jgi:hypothetical protein
MLITIRRVRVDLIGGIHRKMSNHYFSSEGLISVLHLSAFANLSTHCLSLVLFVNHERHGRGIDYFKVYIEC